MRLRLKENPREWQKFTAVLAAMAVAMAWWLQRRGVLPVGALGGVVLLALAAFGLALVRPVWFRGVYRGGMTVTFRIGQVMGAILLTLLFLLVLTPLGLLLRAMGKDLLHLRPLGRGESYWRVPPPPGRLDRQF